MTEGGKIGPRTKRRRGVLGKSLIISSLTHALFLYFLTGFPNKDFSNIFKRDKRLSQEPIYVSLSENGGQYPKSVAYNPNTPIGSKIQSSDIDKELGNTGIKEKADGLEGKILRTPNIILKSRLEELYKHTYKPGERNEVSYEEFLNIYINVHLRNNDLYGQNFTYLRKKFFIT